MSQPEAGSKVNQAKRGLHLAAMSLNWSRDDSPLLMAKKEQKDDKERAKGNKTGNKTGNKETKKEQRATKQATKQATRRQQVVNK